MTFVLCNVLQRLLPGPLWRSLIIQQRRSASVSTTTSSQFGHYTTALYPFPIHPNPTPHEIFHLPRGASQSQVKARYYELVRVHHPDCPSARDLPPTISHARFQAISNAYAILSGKKPASSTNGLDDDTLYHEEILRRKRAQWRASAGSDEFGRSGPSLWELQEREKFDQAALVFVIVLALAASVLPLSLLSPFAAGRQRHDEAAKNLADARREARDVSEVRRLAMLQRKNNLDIVGKQKEKEEDNVG